METKLKKNIEFKIGNNTYTNVRILKICPFCNVGNNPTTDFVGAKRVGDYVYCFFSHLCTNCDKTHWTVEKKFFQNKGDGEIISVIPHNGTTEFQQNISELSPRFVDIFHQAETAENMELFDIAGMGYRAALEILIKDFGLKSAGEKKETIERYSLQDAIEHYFKKDSIEGRSAGNYVRKNGNDFIHWQKDKSSFDAKSDLPIMKDYLEIVINEVNIKILLKKDYGD